jgi:hypothetical protein
LVLFSVLFSVNCLAQVSVSGEVISQDNKKPVVNASVFISNSTIGDKTSAEGAFVLRGVKPGNYLLVISIVGFESYSQPIVVSNSNLVLPVISLIPKTILLAEVKVHPISDANRDKYYSWFSEEFLGRSDLAKSCKITNPEVLNFNYNETTQLLTVTADDFIVIENQALGYRIMYSLSGFVKSNDIRAPKVHYDGYAFFQKIDNPKQEKAWQSRRSEVYQGSLMHFLRSIITNRINEEGFRVLQFAKFANPERPADSVIQKKIAFFEKAIPEKILYNTGEGNFVCQKTFKL